MEIKIELKGIDAALTLFDEQKVRRAAKMSINDTIKTIKTATSHEIREKWAIPKKNLDPFLKITNKATVGKLEARLTVKSHPLSLSYFKTREVTNRLGVVAIRESGRKFDKYQKSSSMARGLSTKILKNKPFITIRRGFSIRHSKGGLSHWRRTGPGKWGKMDGAHIIRVITVASMFQQAQVTERIDSTLHSTWGKRFRHHLWRELNK